MTSELALSKAVERQILDRAPAYTKSCRYLQEHSKELRDAYPGHWVAIDDGRVVAHDSDFQVVLSELRDEGLEPAWTLMILLDVQPQPRHFHA